MTSPIHQTPSPAIDLAIALEESKRAYEYMRAYARELDSALLKSQADLEESRAAERVLRDEIAELRKQAPGSVRAYLSDLVCAMDGANISSWQTTAYWQTELDAAREYLATPDQTNEQ